MRAHTRAHTAFLPWFEWFKWFKGFYAWFVAWLPEFWRGLLVLEGGMNTETRSKFATRIGKDKSYVTRLDQAGRLVLVGEGRSALVDVEASLKRIEETTGGRDDVAARHAAAKGQQSPKPDETRVSAQTRKEMAQADVAEMERDVMRGKLIDREQVEAALADVVAFARQGVENLPHRVAAQLVGKDFEQVVAILREAISDSMAETHKEASKRLAELVKVEA